MSNIVLVGFMGCGKSSTARYISKQYNLKFVDTDRLIEKKTHMTIKEIFEKKGENYFRNLERTILKTNIEFCKNCVIATGGGLPCQFDNMNILKKIGWVFWLKIDFDDIKNRLKNRSNRPLFNDNQKAKELFNLRTNCYTKAHFHIDANNSLEIVVEKIFDKISS